MAQEDVKDLANKLVTLVSQMDHDVVDKMTRYIEAEPAESGDFRRLARDRARRALPDTHRDLLERTESMLDAAARQIAREPRQHRYGSLRVAARDYLLARLTDGRIDAADRSSLEDLWAKIIFWTGPRGSLG